MSDSSLQGLGRIRFAGKLDASEIKSFINESTRMNFRITEEPQILNLFTDNVISIVQLDISGSIIGFLSLKDYPMEQSINPGAWEDVMWKNYRAVELNARNTLFIHMFCWKSGYGRELVDNILRSVFMHDAYLHHIAMIKSFEKYQLLDPGNASAEASFRRVQAMVRGASADKLPSLWIADRNEISPRLRIRRAVEEDNDDIIPILEGHSPRLKQMYGEYYISELVAHPGSRVLLVCEYKEVAVGIMCLNTDINYETLANSFVLSPFAGLKHMKEPINESLRSSRVESFTDMIMESNQRSRFRNYSFVASKHDIKVNWTCNSSSKSSEDAYAGFLDLLQDEDIEYEIVNIEEEFMRVPRQLSIDQSTKSTIEFREFLEKMSESHDSFDETQARYSHKISIRPVTLMESEKNHFTGEPNAFLLELFAIHPDFDERYGFEILEATYELFPEREYCVLSLPSNHAPFPLLEHFTLVTPLHNHQTFINETLYVAHINSIKGILRVRAGEAHDLHYLSPIVEYSGRREHLLDLFHSSLKPNARKAISFVLLSENQPVGVVLIGPLVGAETIRAQFNVRPNPKAVRTDGMILGAIVSPLFEPHYRWFLREVIRQSRFATLLWPLCVLGKGDLSLQRNLMTMFNYMVPLYSRLPIPNLTRVAYMNILSEKSAKPLAYCGIIRPITSLPKIDINNNIVIVGSSSTGLAFIEALVLGLQAWYLNFTNITLVSENGLSQVLDSLSAAVTCVPRYGRFTNSYMKKVPYICYIDIVSGVMVKINRKSKYIVLRNHKFVYYDTLVLTCGLQFQPPGYMRKRMKSEKIIRQDQSCPHRRMDDPKYQPDRLLEPREPPSNVMIINDITDANLCLKKLMALIEDSKNTASRLASDRTIIVYGNSIEVYTCMAALLELKIDPKLITFIESYNDDLWPRVNCFNDEKIDDRVQKTIEDLGIQVYRRCNMVSWSLKRSYVKSITLMSTFRRFELNCFVMFFYGFRDINVNTFRAMNESGLVYDGGLVVGADFETNDPHIYGAGTCTRYSRQLYADKYLHKYYYSEDIGETLATMFLNHLDPFSMMDEYAKSSRSVLPFYSPTLLKFLGSHTNLQKDNTLPGRTRRPTWTPILKFNSPVFVYAILPGPLYYLKLRKPGPNIPMEVALSLPHQGHTLETENNENFYRMNFSALHIFDGATCLCKSKFQPDFYLKLYGKHERFFNNLFTRYEAKLVNDLYDYTTEPWIAALYLFCFGLVLKNINLHQINTLTETNLQPVHTITDIKGKSSALLLEAFPDMRFNPFMLSGSFRSFINKIVGEEFVQQFMDRTGQHLIRDLPEECGQSEEIRAETEAYWKAIDGERIVWYYLSAYLHRYAVTNPQYQKPKPELTFMCHL